MDMVGDCLYVAASWDGFPPPGAITLDCTTFPDAEIDEYAARVVSRLATATQVLRSQEYTVVLRCQAGRNRSALVAAICLVKDGLTPDEAIAAVRQARGHLRGGVLTNESFTRYIGGLVQTGN